MTDLATMEAAVREAGTGDAPADAWFRFVDATKPAAVLALIERVKAAEAKTVVTEEMVERAHVAYWSCKGLAIREAIRIALIAAMEDGA